MAAHRTRADLVRAAGALLLNLPPSATLSDEDYTTIDASVDGLVDELAVDTIHIADVDAIEPAVFQSLRIVLAAYNAPDFGAQVDDTAARRRLRTLTATKPTYERQVAEYF